MTSPSSVREPDVTPDEYAIVQMIADGYTRWAIADRLELNEDTVRRIVRSLCARFNCPMRDLPEALGLIPYEEDDE